MEMIKYDEYYKTIREESLQNFEELDIKFLPESDARAFEFISDLGMDEWIKTQNPFDISAVTSIFKAAYKKNLDENETVQMQGWGKKAFQEMVKNGLNIEQIKLHLAKEEKAWTQELVSYTKESKTEINDLHINEAKQKLKEIYAYSDIIQQTESPYDNLFDISVKIAKLKKANNKLNNGPSISDDDLNQYQKNESTIEELKENLATQLLKFDPRVVQDVINDKMATEKLNSEISQIQKGKTISEASQNELRYNLSALQAQVYKDIKNYEQNNEAGI